MEENWITVYLCEININSQIYSKYEFPASRDHHRDNMDVPKKRKTDPTDNFHGVEHGRMQLPCKSIEKLELNTLYSSKFLFYATFFSFGSATFKVISHGIVVQSMGWTLRSELSPLTYVEW